MLEEGFQRSEARKRAACGQGEQDREQSDRQNGGGRA
jgi:hypothetical protein